MMYMEQALIKISIVIFATNMWADGRYFYDDCIDNIGTEFVFMFSEHYIKGSLVKVYCSTPLESDVSVRIQTPIWAAGSVDITVTVTPSLVTEVDLPRTVRMTGTGKGTSSILVTASDTITVYASDIQINTGDAFMVYPTDALGNEYIDVTYNQTSTTYSSSLGVVALYDLTVVEIDPPPQGSISYEGTEYTAGQMLSVTINKYELFQIQSHDLSGTHVRSSLPLSVISAHEYIRMGTSSSKDFMQTMLPPVSSLSTSYVVFGLPMYTKPEVVRIVNSRENTTITITLPSVSVYLEKIGSIYDFEVAPGVGAVITADKGVIVALVSKSRSMSPYGDPRVIVALSVDQFLSEYTFPIANLTGKLQFTHRIVIMAKTSDVSHIKLDNSYTSDLGLAWTELTDTDLSVTYTILDVGVHNLTSDDVTSVFGGYLAGHGSTEEYGMVPGRYLGNTNQSVCTDNVSCNYGRYRRATFTQRDFGYIPSSEPIVTLQADSIPLCQAKCLTIDTCVYMAMLVEDGISFCKLYDSKASCSQMVERVGIRLYKRHSGT